MSAAIELSDVGKRYWQMQEEAMLLRSLIPGKRTTKIERWALRHIDLNIDTGETVGILGHNGAGKTTLLRLLAGVSRPTEGHVRIVGRIAPLLSVGVGFHQELSGRENVLVNGMLLGLTRREVEQRFDQIVAFAELEQFIDTPVKFYSSGMFMRLGFAVAVHVDPNVLLVDEVLAVGDIAFQLKCFERMRYLQSQGTTIVLVSHSIHAIRLLCPRALLIRRGHLELDGTAEDVIARHHELMSGDAQDLSDGAPRDFGEGVSEHPYSVTTLDRLVITPQGPGHHADPGERLTYRCRLRFGKAVADPQFTFTVTSADGVPCYAMRTRITHRWRSFEAGDEIDVDVSFLAHLGGGTYRLSILTTTVDNRQVLGDDPTGALIYVAPRVGASGFVDLDAKVSVGDQDLTQHESLMLNGEG